MNSSACPKCGGVDLVMTFDNSPNNLKLECSDCNLKWRENHE